MLLIGRPGTAKTSTVLQVLSKLNPAETVSKTVSFSSATTPGSTVLVASAALRIARRRRATTSSGCAVAVI